MLGSLLESADRALDGIIYGGQSDMYQHALIGGAHAIVELERGARVLHMFATW